MICKRHKIEFRKSSGGGQTGHSLLVLVAPTSGVDMVVVSKVVEVLYQTPTEANLQVMNIPTRWNHHHHREDCLPEHPYRDTLSNSGQHLTHSADNHSLYHLKTNVQLPHTDRQNNHQKHFLVLSLINLQCGDAAIYYLLFTTGCVLNL